MRVRLRNQQDFACGVLFLAIAVGGFIVAMDYPMGTAVRMSAGYFPRMLCLLLGVIGVYAVLRSLTVEGEAIERIGLRPVLLVPLAVLLFALSIRSLGLVVAAFAIVVVGSLASPQMRWRETLVAAAVLAAGTVALFIWGIGLLIPVWPEF